MHTSAEKPLIKTIHPSILYYGTPVILLTTLNEDDSMNISPLSSSWALGRSIVLGVGLGGKAIENLKKRPECVINIPGPSLWEQVEKLAPYTGKDPVPDFKLQSGFRHEKDKYGIAGLTPMPSLSVTPTRILECPIQIEARVSNIHNPANASLFAIVETEAVHIHAHQDIVRDENHIDPNQWSPLIYNFRHYFGLGHRLGKTFRAEV